MKGSLLSKLDSNVRKLSKGHKKIASYIKENYDNDILYQLASYLRSLYNVDKKQLEKYISSSDLSIDLKEKLNIDGMSIIQNNGDVQEVKHYHMHLKPYYKENNGISVEEVYKKLIG